MAKNLNIYSIIDELRERYLRAATGKSALLQMIDEAEISEQVYNSNAIENSTLSLDDTEKILMQIDLDRYISERELFEAKNLAKVVDYINKKAKDKNLDKDMILFFHKILLSNISDDVAGRFRNETDWVRVDSYIALDPKLIQDAINEMIIEYNAYYSQNIIKRIAKFHLTFEHIHPFVDGNGRIGRVLNNYILIREGFVPVNIKFIDRQMYYEAFREFDAGKKTAKMEEIVGKALTNSYHKRLAYLEGKRIITLADYARESGSSHSNLINKAKRQTIEAFMERGVWKIGV